MMSNDTLFSIGTTRFNNKTFQENIEWRQSHNWKGCMYGLNKKISNTVKKNALIYILEMNNEKNEIEGIGLIRNFINRNHKARIYKNNRWYNRFIYNSSHRINRNEITNQKLLRKLERKLFFGPKHFKRGQGITILNKTMFDDIFKRDVDNFLSNLFNI